MPYTKFPSLILSFPSRSERSSDLSLRDMKLVLRSPVPDYDNIYLEDRSQSCQSPSYTNPLETIKKESHSTFHFMEASTNQQDGAEDKSSHEKEAKEESKENDSSPSRSQDEDYSYNEDMEIQASHSSYSKSYQSTNLKANLEMKRKAVKRCKWSEDWVEE